MGNWTRIRKSRKYLLSKWLKTEKARLESLLSNEKWKDEFQVKIIFARLCREALKSDHVRIRDCYIDIALANKPEILKDLIEIFEKIK